MKQCSCVIFLLAVVVSIHSSQVQKSACGEGKTCHLGQCCSSETILDTERPSTSVKWKCKAYGKEGEICNNFGNQYCNCDIGLRCKATGTWFFGNGYCVKLDPLWV